MNVGGTLDAPMGAVSFAIAGTDGATRLLPGLAGSVGAHTVSNAAVASDLLLLFGFLLLLLATFALAVAHGARTQRTICIFLLGLGLVCAGGLVAEKVHLMAATAESLEFLRGAAGFFAAAAVLVLWPALSGIGARTGRDEAAFAPAHLPLTAAPGGALSLAEALTGSGATVFAYTVAQSGDARSRWAVPAAPAAPPLRERLTAAVKDAFGRQTPVVDQFESAGADGGARWFEVTLRPGRFADGQAGAIGTLLDVTRFRKAEAEYRHLLQEATHRTKNLLTIIQSVARMSAKTLGLSASAAEPFNARLQAIAMSYDLLVREDWRGVPLNDLLHSQLNHSLGNAAGRASWSGPALRLKPTAVQTMALAIHELAARSASQGAMATPAGRLRIVWEHTAMRDGSPGYRLAWQDIGHAPQAEGAPRNYAREILERLTPRGLRGEVTATETPEGFRWELRFPALNVVSPEAE